MNESQKVELFYQSIKDKSKNHLLLFGDCLEKLKLLNKKSIDLILTDLPYGISQNKWDTPINLEKLWKEYNRIIKSNGIIILTAAQPFTTTLIMSNPKMFKYDIIWEKTIGSGQLNIKRMPLRVHENILVFYNKPGTYNEQLSKGNPYKIDRKINFKGEGYGSQKESSKKNDGFRHARSVVKFSNPRIKNGHPTQKPLNLLEYLIKTYSNEKDIVVDCCVGSGSTGIAALNTDRNFIGIENSRHWFERAEKWIDQEHG